MMTGGAGADSFTVYRIAGERDTITDCQGCTDHILLHGTLSCSWGRITC